MKSKMKGRGGVQKAKSQKSRTVAKRANPPVSRKEQEELFKKYRRCHAGLVDKAEDWIERLQYGIDGIREGSYVMQRMRLEDVAIEMHNVAIRMDNLMELSDRLFWKDQYHTDPSLSESN